MKKKIILERWKKIPTAFELVAPNYITICNNFYEHFFVLFLRVNACIITLLPFFTFSPDLFTFIVIRMETVLCLYSYQQWNCQH